jgi:hypothetical protein
MKSTIFNYLSTTASNLSMQDILVNFTAATVIAIIIFISYRITHSRAVYSAKFNVSLIMMTVITTLVMSVIGNNIALSLGMVGALSIVRFRTAVKDTRDTVYIFWCIAVGICCGVSEYLLVGVGSCVIFLALLLLGAVHSDDNYLIITRASSEKESEIMDVMVSFFNGKASLKVNNSTKDVCELIFEISGKNLLKRSKGNNIADRLYDIETVSMVNIICQNDELSR